MALILCPKCGHRISALAPQCPRCGLPQSEYAPHEAEQSTASATTPTRGKRSFKWVVVAAVLIAVSVGAALYLLTDDKRATEVAQPPAPGKYLGHTWVDLGLSVMWASCNVGANGDPSEYGKHYQWGMTYVHSSYRSYTCDTYGDRMSNIGGVYRYDVATNDWSGEWRMPSQDEFQELIDKCTWEWTEYRGQSGFSVTGPNGNKIFLPAAGVCYDYDHNDRDNVGCYWSSNPYEDDNYYSVALYFDVDCGEIEGCYLSTKARYYGCSVRPVCPRSVADRRY